MNENTYRRKARAILLAAVMITSMVAAGATIVAPAAAQQFGDRTPTDGTEVAPGETITVEVPVSVDSGSIATIDEVVGSELTIDTDSVSLSNAQVGVDTTLFEPTEDDIFITFAQDADIQTETLTYDVTVPDSASDGDTFTLEGEVTDNDESSASTTVTLNVVEDDGGDGGDGGDGEEPADAVTPEDLNVVFQGEEFTINVDEQFESVDGDTVSVEEGDIIQLRQGILGDGDGERVATATAENVNGTLQATFEQADTDELPADFHFVRTNGFNLANTQFETEVQELTTEFDPDSVTTESTETVLTVESDNYEAQDGVRGNTFSLEINADSFDHGELAEIFAAASENDDADEGDPVTVEGVAPGDSFDADLDSFDTADYEFDVSVVETTGSDSAEVEVAEPIDATAALGNGTVEENIGDIAEIPVELTGTNQATVQIVIDGYEASATVVDEDDDDEVVLEFNTATAGDGTGDALSVAGDDTLQSATDDSIDQRIPQDSYSVRVDLNEQRQDRGQLILTERSTDAVSAHIAPAAASGPTDDADAFLEAQTPSTVVAQGDTAGILIQVSGVQGSFDGFSGEDGVTFELVKQDPGAFEDAESFSSDSDAIDVVEAGADQYLVEIDTADSDLADIGAFDVEFTVDGEENPYVAEDETEELTTELIIEDASANFVDPTDDGVYTLTTGEEVIVRGETNLAPGTGVTVNVAGDAFFDSSDDPVEVSESGTFEATFDLSGVDPDQGVSIDAEFDTGLGIESDAEFGETQETEGVSSVEELEQQVADLQEQLNESDTTISELNDEIDSLTEELSTVEDERAELQNELANAEATIGDLEGQVSDLEDTNSELESTNSDLESQVSELEGADESLQTILDELGVDNADAAVDEIQNLNESSDSDDSGPGFGIAAALVALIAAALLAVRRRD